jgi:5'-3' exonuclease
MVENWIVRTKTQPYARAIRIGDLIMLGLVTHEPEFPVVVREMSVMAGRGPASTRRRRTCYYTETTP